MNELLRHIGLGYYHHKEVISVPDDVNIISKTSYAYHMKCTVGIYYEVKNIYLSNNERLFTYYWKCNMSYLGVK